MDDSAQRKSWTQRPRAASVSVASRKIAPPGMLAGGTTSAPVASSTLYSTTPCTAKPNAPEVHVGTNEMIGCFPKEGPNTRGWLQTFDSDSSSVSWLQHNESRRHAGVVIGSAPTSAKLRIMMTLLHFNGSEPSANSSATETTPLIEVLRRGNINPFFRN